MPFCPKCRYEYNPHVSKCPDCEETLVSELPPEEEGTFVDAEQYDDWVQLARFNSDGHAHMIEDALRSSGIPVVVLSGAGHFGQTGQMGFSSFRPVGGGFSMVVPAEFAEQADQIGGSILGEIWMKARLVDFE